MLAFTLLLLQGGPPSLSASVDRDRVAVGEEVVLSVRAVSHSVEPLQVSLAPMNGFEVIGRSEQTEVSLGAGPTRVTTLEVELRALRAGVWPLGPVRARQGQQILQTGALKVTVTSGPGTSTATSLSPRVKRILERAPPPARGGKAAVSVLASEDTVFVGEQVDVVTAAWFPRDLRSQLRRPPTLQPPAAEGVWSYPQPVPPGIAASRRVGGTWYDLFVMHQVIFPLVPGQLRISEASLRYSVPVAVQFFSQEEPFTLESRPVTLTVLPLPAAGKPAGFSGAVGRGIAIARSVRPAAGRAGEALTVEIGVSGRGNVALWPTPDLAWPAGVRAYTDKVDDQLGTTNGMMGGTKTFHELAVPDSAGTLVLPALRYPYFDLDTRSYRVAAAPATAVSVAAASEAATARALPPDLITSASPPLAERVTGAVPGWIWALLVLLPPVAAVAQSVGERRRLRRPRASRPVAGGADRRLHAALRALVPDVDRYSGPALSSALRAAGVDAAIAARVTAAREAYLAACYGPRPGGADAAKLARELDELTERLGATSRRGPRRAAVASLLLLVAATPVRAQTNPEQLYRSGALRAAADGFARRARAEPDVPAHWYALGAARYRLGAEGAATAAWLRAARLAPRAAAVRRALRMVPAPDDESAHREWTAPVTPPELALAAFACWLVGWFFLVRGRGRIRARVVGLLTAALVLGSAAFALADWYREPLAIVADAGPLRLSPHGRAPEVAQLAAGTAVRPLREAGGWWLVNAAEGRTGWVPAGAITPVHD
ncbi:MAG TPA: BatD family protein [Gemmatimonadales bacterium]|jgi:hypothetical protein|nr:BatD family protein [Gemmatimonadales bacterium]